MNAIMLNAGLRMNHYDDADTPKKGKRHGAWWLNDSAPNPKAYRARNKHFQLRPYKDCVEHEWRYYCKEGGSAQYVLYSCAACSCTKLDKKGLTHTRFTNKVGQERGVV